LYTRSFAHNFASAPAWQHPLAVEVAESADGAATVEAIRAKLSLSGPRMWDRKALLESLPLWQRLAVLTNLAHIAPQWLRDHGPKLFVPLFSRCAASMPLAAQALAEALAQTAPDPGPIAPFSPARITRSRSAFCRSSPSRPRGSARWRAWRRCCRRLSLFFVRRTMVF